MIDISNAFVKVVHRGVLHKLSSYGICGNIHAIVKSFLSGRSLKVVVNCQSSRTYSINASISQCFTFCPTLFLLFINDLPNHTIVDIYADDSTLYQSTSDVADDPAVATSLSSDLKQVV